MAHTLANTPHLISFLNQEAAATIAVAIDEAGTIHAASLLYWHIPDPLRFYFVTSKETEKTKLLKQKDVLPAACVVGTTRNTDFTLQMRGQLRIVDKDIHAPQLEQYYAKRGDHHDDIVDPVNVLLEFTPSWARYVDYTEGYQRYMLELA